jgi:hypothetical protein
MNLAMFLVAVYSEYLVNKSGRRKWEQNSLRPLSGLMKKSA